MIFSKTLDKMGVLVYNKYARSSVIILYTQVCALSIGLRKFECEIFERMSVYEFCRQTESRT